jgi:hypothetical protein
MTGSEPSTAVEPLDNSILSRPSSSFDSQSQAGSATKIVSQACAEASSNESTQFPQKNDLLNDENGRKRTYKTYSADRHKYIYINLQTVESPGRRNATPAGTHTYTSQRRADADYPLRRRWTRRSVQTDADRCSSRDGRDGQPAMVNIRCMYGSRTILTQPEFTFWGIIKLS